MKLCSYFLMKGLAGAGFEPRDLKLMRLASCPTALPRYNFIMAYEVGFSPTSFHSNDKSLLRNVLNSLPKLSILLGPPEQKMESGDGHLTHHLLRAIAPRHFTLKLPDMASG